MRTRLVVAVTAVLVVVTSCGGGAPSPAATPTASPGATPTPAATAAPSLSPSAAPSSLAPSPTPLPSPPTPSSSPVSGAVGAASLPVRANAASIKVALAPAPDGRLYVSVPAKKGTVLALLDARGRAHRGWPVLLKRASDCVIDADTSDGSVRAVCTVGKRVRAFALDAGGKLAAGWPIDLRDGSLQTHMSDAARVVDGDLYVLLGRSGDSGGDVRIVRVSPGGAVDMGAWVRGVMHFGCCSAVGPDGAAYVQGDDGIWAIDLDGTRPGFPVAVGGWASRPAFGPDGRLYVVNDIPDDDEGSPQSDVVVITEDGQIAPGWPATIPVDTWTAFGDPTGPPLAPVVSSDGVVMVAGWTDGTVGTVAYALGRSGARRPGWPYQTSARIRRGKPSGFVCLCEPCAFPELAIDTPPILGPDNSLVLVLLGDTRLSGGNQIVAIDPGGNVGSGWPVTLTEKGSWFAGIAAASGTVYGYAVEPTGTHRNSCDERDPNFSGTIVALDRHGHPVYSTTLVVP